MNQISITPALLESMTQCMVEAVQPQKIVLFGSQARGDSGPSSDLDFLVVVDSTGTPSLRRYQLAGLLYRALHDFRVAKDVLVYSPDEVERYRGLPHHVVATALREGRVLYDRAS